MREILALQPRFERREGKRALRLLENTRFRAAYDFLLLRAAAGAVDPEVAQWWTDIQSLSPEEKLARVDSQPKSEATTRRPRRRRRRRRPAAP